MRCGEAMAVSGMAIFSEISVRDCFFIFIYLNVLYIIFKNMNMKVVIFSSVEYHCLCKGFPDNPQKTIQLFPLLQSSQ